MLLWWGGIGGSLMAMCNSQKCVCGGGVILYVWPEVSLMLYWCTKQGNKWGTSWWWLLGHHTYLFKGGASFVSQWLQGSIRNTDVLVSCFQSHLSSDVALINWKFTAQSPRKPCFVCLSVHLFPVSFPGCNASSHLFHPPNISIQSLKHSPTCQASFKSNKNNNKYSLALPTWASGTLETDPSPISTHSWLFS